MKNNLVYNKKYRPNLVSLMSLCAGNYLRLIKLLADKSQKGETRSFTLGTYLSYHITIEEVTKYTTLVTLVQQGENDKYRLVNDNEISNSALNKASLEHEFLPTQTKFMHPCIKIRLYHDAQMAEVISFQRIQQIKPRYDYPNKHMHQQDEKQQINQFLKEWLQLCLTLGQAKVVLS